MSVRWVAASVVLAAVSGSLCACDDGSARAARPALSSTAAQHPGAVTPSAPVDLSTMSPGDIGAQALQLARARRSGGMRLSALNGAVAVVDVSSQYDLDRGVARADLQLRHPMTNHPTETLTAVTEHGEHYVGASAQCYFAFPDRADPAFAFELDTWSGGPGDLLAAMSFVSYDAYALRLHVTIPTRLAAVLVGAEVFVKPYRPALLALRGRVPAEVRLGDDGSFAELYVEGAAVAHQLQDLPGIDPHVLHYLPFVHGRAADEGAAADVSVPPRSQLKARPSDCGGSLDT